MRHDLVISESIDINATPSKVWEALTKPEIIKKYLFGTETITDWQAGSEIIFQGEYGESKYRDKGVIVRNIPGELLSYTYWSGFSGLEDMPENYSLITYSLKSDEDKKTTFTWTQKGYATEERYQHSLTGMKEFLKKIKQIIEEEPVS